MSRVQFDSDVFLKWNKNKPNKNGPGFSTMTSKNWLLSGMNQRKNALCGNISEFPNQYSKLGFRIVNLVCLKTD